MLNGLVVERDAIFSEDEDGVNTDRRGSVPGKEAQNLSEILSNRISETEEVLQTPSPLDYDK